MAATKAKMQQICKLDTRANATFAKIHDSYVVYAKVATAKEQARTGFKGCFVFLEQPTCSTSNHGAAGRGNHRVCSRTDAIYV